MTTTMDHHKFIIYQCLCEAGQTTRTACLPEEEGVGVMGVGGGGWEGKGAHDLVRGSPDANMVRLGLNDMFLDLKKNKD